GGRAGASVGWRIGLCVLCVGALWTLWRKIWLLAEEFLEFLERVAAGPLDEGFAEGALLFEGVEEAGDGGVHLLGTEAAEECAADALLVVHAAADDQVVAFGAVLELGADEADVAAVVLGAGVRAAGEVDVERAAGFGAFAEVFDEGDGVGLGVGGGVFAAAVAGAGDDAAGEQIGLGGGAVAGDGAAHGLDEGVGDVRDDDVLPGGEAEFAFAEVGGEVGEGVHLLGRKAADGHADADGVEAGLGLFVDAEPGVFAHGAAGLAGLEGETAE